MAFTSYNFAFLIIFLFLLLLCLCAFPYLGVAKGEEGCRLSLYLVVIVYEPFQVFPGGLDLNLLHLSIIVLLGP